VYQTKLAIIIPTLNRLPHLMRLCDTIKYKVTQPAQIIIVDGGSTDGTLEKLRTWPSICHGKPICLIEQGEALGAISAVNEGCTHLTDEIEYVIILNDDCLLPDGGIDLCVTLLDRDYDQAFGQVAIPYTYHGRLKIDPITIGGKQYIYANFGVTRREIGDRVSWWNIEPVDGKRAIHYGGDCALSMKIRNLGLDILKLTSGHKIIHNELQDETRRPNTDSEIFYKRWRDWRGPYDDRYLSG